MKNRSSADARLLFVIDNDFGALGLVMYLLFRQKFATRTTILLPARAHALHGESLSVGARAYRSLQDILDVVEQESPDLVCLFSGYILTTHELLTVGELEKLVRELRRRGCLLATSDPYLGTYRKSMVAASNSITLSRQAGWLTRFFRDRLLLRHVRQVAGCLEDIKHVIAVPGLQTSRSRADYLSFYNPDYIRERDELREISAAVSTYADVDSTRPRWLFVLARFDFVYQQYKHGRQGFEDIVVAKLREALQNDRHPTLIAPVELIDSISQYFDTGSGVSLLTGCSFAEFEQRLLDAEMAFYWQIFSTSTFLRLLHGLPVYSFDSGHTAHLSKSFHETCLAHYYLADPPILIDVAERLDAARLLESGKGFAASAQSFRAKLSGLPTPVDMVDRVLAEG